MFGVYRSRLTAVALVALSATARAAGPYINAQHRFAITPPVGWVEVKALDAVVAFAEPGPSGPPAAGTRGKETDSEFIARVTRKLETLDPAAARARANITVVSIRQPGVTLGAYVATTRRKVNKSRSAVILGEADRRLVSQPAIERSARIDYAKRQAVRMREIMCVRGDRVFIVTLAAPTGAFQKASAAFNKSLASFTWL